MTHLSLFQNKLKDLLSTIGDVNSVYFKDIALKHLAEITLSEIEKKLEKTNATGNPLILHGIERENLEKCDYVKYSKIVLEFKENTIDFSDYDTEMLLKLFLSSDENNIELGLQLLKGMEGIPLRLNSLVVGLFLGRVSTPIYREIVENLIKRALPSPVFQFLIENKRNRIYIQSRNNPYISGFPLAEIVNFFIPIEKNELTIWPNILFQSPLQFFNFEINFDKGEVIPDIIKLVKKARKRTVRIFLRSNGSLLSILKSFESFIGLYQLDLESLDGKVTFPQKETIPLYIHQLSLMNFSNLFANGQEVKFPNVERLSIIGGKNVHLTLRNFHRIHAIEIRDADLQKFDCNYAHEELRSIRINNTEWREEIGLEIAKLEHIYTLSIRNAGMMKIPIEWYGLEKLRTLILCENKLAQIPYLSLYHSLEYINLSSNNINQFTASVLMFPKLKSLDLSKNRVKNINPDDLRRIFLKEDLNVSIRRNKIEILPTVKSVKKEGITLKGKIVLSGNPILNDHKEQYKEAFGNFVEF